MAGLRHALKLFSNSSNVSYHCTRRLLNYSAMAYDGKADPAETFFNDKVQSLLKSLTRVDYNKVFKRRKLGEKHLSDPVYKFMTEEELKEALEVAKETAEELLQIPPVVRVRDQNVKVLSRDPALQGLETSRLVFIDITYGTKDSDRLIVVREPDGTLQEAEWQLRQRMNQTYFPQDKKYLETPKMFEGEYFESLLDRHQYEYILDRACIQFEPDDVEYQKAVTVTYQHVNDNNKFELLRSTRHFGSLTFFLVWNKIIDNLLLDLIETLHIHEAQDLIAVYSLVHKISFEGEQPLDQIKDFIKKSANKKAALELAIQAYEDTTVERAASF
ncbi:unnamed protein product [Ceutorhynchus assimilis]|uniref:Mitochondrial ribosomal protein S22 n=1 Tax=Ceutorhynchus assimilis TaxID=467358 RepID=A0A9N9QKF6_9CUCU|nr:unnamed protein product [Ceutorhynchus assimilis]